MKISMLKLALAWLAVVAAPASKVQAQVQTRAQEPGDCWLCVNYPGEGGTWHFWPDWGGGVCPDSTGGNQCLVRPSGEGEEGMPGYSGQCSGEDCNPGGQLLAAAAARQDAGLTLTLLTEYPETYALDREGGAIQIRGCNGSVVAAFALMPAVADQLGIHRRSAPYPTYSTFLRIRRAVAT